MNITFKIVNVVATSSLDATVDFESLHKLFPHQVIYHKDIYRGRVAYFKSKNMEGKVAIFHSGKIISVGTKSTEKAITELESVAKTLKTSLKTMPKIQSIVATSKIEASIDLESFLLRTRKNKDLQAIYEPEQFPGAIIKFPVDGALATILLFSSGKLVCVGLTRSDHIHKALEQLSLLLA